MNHNSINIKRLLRVSVLVALAMLLSLASGALARGLPAVSSYKAISQVTDDFQVLFKLDPRLLGPTYGGPRWVLPALYDVNSGGATYTIEAMAQVQSSTAPVSADWAPANPDLVSVTYNQDNTVALQIHGQGASSLDIHAGGATSTLYIMAGYTSPQCTHLRVTVSQTSVPTTRTQTCSVMLPMVVNR